MTVCDPDPDKTLRPTLCVSLHDVAPATQSLCKTLLATVHAVADIPLTLLVVPDYHHLPVSKIEAAAFRRLLDQQLAAGDELALHGFCHLDEGPAKRGLIDGFRRRVLTLSEGEFAALDEQEAGRRLEAGLHWLAERGWQVEGFVAPAWLLSSGSWAALRRFPFCYTTSLRNFYLLPQMQTLLSPGLVYSARNSSGRWLSCRWNELLMREAGRLPLVRLCLHPNDARYPAQLRHVQKCLARLLETHTPRTKAAFARRW